MKKLLLILASLLVLLVAVVVTVGVVLYQAGKSGSGEIEDWIGSQLQSIANSYLNPQLSFDHLDYRYPGTVMLQHLKLEANDPNTGAKVNILGASSAEIQLAEIPKVGQPIVIEKIILKEPEFRAIAIEPKSAKLVGFSNFMKQTADAMPAATQPAERAKLSAYFKMKLIQLIDGRIVYDPRVAGTDAMDLDKINTRFDIEPSTAGDYKLKCEIVRDPIFKLLLDGKLDIDTFEAKDLKLALNADLSAEKLNFLPPQLQKVLKQYEAQGSLQLDVSGDVPLFHPSDGKLDAKLSLSKANVTFTDYRIPVDDLLLQLAVADRKATLQNLSLHALGGEAKASGTLLLNDAMDASLSLTIAEMQIHNLLSASAEGGQTQLAGRVNAKVQATAPAAVLLAKWNTPPGKAETGLAASTLPKDWGGATLDVDQGHLLVLPVVRELNTAMRKVTSLVSGSSEPRDRLTADCGFSGDRIEIRDINFASDTVAARGRGEIRLDHSIDLTLNGGPLEKVQSKLGEFGKILGAVTDSIASYHVTGTLENASVSVEVGEKAVHAVERVGDKVGEGINKIGEGIDKILRH